MAVEWDEMDQKLTELSESPTFRVWREAYASLSLPEQVFFAVQSVQDEVNNGGFWQFFMNGSGHCVPDLVEFLRTIGADETAVVAENAIEAVGVDIPWSDNEARQASIDALSQGTIERLNELDEEFMEYPDDLTELLYNYVCAHRQEIGAPASF